MKQTCQEMSRGKKVFHKYISSKTKKTNSVELLFKRGKSINRWFRKARNF